MPLTVAVFLVGVALVGSPLFFKKTGVIQERGILGGPSPSFVASAEGAELGQVALIASGAETVAPSGNGSIALAATPDAIQNGVVEDTASAINPSFMFLQAGADQAAGQSGVAGILESGSASTTPAKLPNYNRDFIMPASGYNWGVLHNYNAVDISNSCGTPVVAAADGLVVPDENIPDVPGGWNDGYGNFVLIQHSFGNNVTTRYAHLESVSVQIGDYVKQGQVIGLMGETGDATGCHLHFEVIGAKNPFVKS
jgi:murein DD-endopeptidase MepM/ murein hydrolase activator NlpD